MTNKKKNTFFILEGIDVQTIEKKYKLDSVQHNITYLEEIVPDKTEFFPFILDKYKSQCITMIDCISKEQIKDGLHCFWCKHSFSTHPIGCPLKYVPNKIKKTFSSNITKEVYDLQQNISKTFIMDNDDIVKCDYYETEGCFCSFNCCLSWIYDQKGIFNPNIKMNNLKYSHSEMLLYKMYFDTFQTIPKEITRAPSWKLLQEYGGFLSIDEFRNSFQTRIFIDKRNVYHNIPKIKVLGDIYEEDTFILKS